jgi:hypothetical protein
METKSWVLCNRLQNLVGQDHVSKIANNPAVIAKMKRHEDCGHIFLIYNDDQFGGFIPKCGFARTETFSLSELSVFFEKPNPDIKLWIVKKEFRKIICAMLLWRPHVFKPVDDALISDDE